jgi:hypothetical protein
MKVFKFSLLLTKSSIEEELYGCEQSIITCKEALLIWKNEFEPILLNNISNNREISNSRLFLKKIFYF